VRVPLVISGPAVTRPNRTNDTLVQAADLFPTVLELAGGDLGAVVPTNVVIDGRSLLGALQATNVLERRAYSELFGSTLSTNVSGQALRDDRYKLIRFTSGQQRFHDVQADPTEQNNLLAGALTAAQQAAYYRLAFALYGYTTNRGPSIAGSAWSNGVFSLSLTPPAAYTLWRSENPSSGFWAPVTNAATVTNGGTVSVLDPAPPAARALYKVVR
jgi:arylsulfatase A-like enzyme